MSYLGVPTEMIYSYFMYIVNVSKWWYEFQNGFYLGQEWSRAGRERGLGRGVHKTAGVLEFFSLNLGGDCKNACLTIIHLDGHSCIQMYVSYFTTKKSKHTKKEEKKKGKLEISGNPLGLPIWVWGSVMGLVPAMCVCEQALCKAQPPFSVLL